ncbi:serine/threonine protein kinase [Plantactinospora sp. KLBMP9567]|uniref:serine/threonine protein kinase n=1 Tax=Plantactinospora sp. KLBMP9567 TaxID=3085900 RepID=UPI002981EDD4|nr:protein kinase [Plantactinospora sp. KLBMP9567]MDW5327067.1 protein kinase [Plantactinospora sp. KLBMP9567]
MTADTPAMHLESLAGVSPTHVFRDVLETTTAYKSRSVVSFTGWSTLLLVERADVPGVEFVAKGFFGYHSVIDAAPVQLRAELHGYYWYRQLPEQAHQYARDHFVQEADLLSRLSGSPYFPNLVEMNLAAPVPHYVMDYLPLGSVRQWLATHGAPSPNAAVAFARRLLTGLAVLHDAGYVHRDINAENVLMADDGPVIADLGCVRALTAAEPRSPKSALISWPPEYDAGYHEADFASDLYCFGMVMYELLAGTMPRYGAPPLRSVATAHDPRLVDLVERCVQWRRDGRPQSAAAALEALS